MPIQNDKGYSLVYVLLIVAMLALLVPPLLHFGVQRGRTARLMAARQQAYHAAEAGLADQIHLIESTLGVTLEPAIGYTYPLASAPLTLNVPTSSTHLKLPDGSTVADQVGLNATSATAGSGNILGLAGVHLWTGIRSVGSASVPTSINPSGQVQVTLSQLWVSVQPYSG